MIDDLVGEGQALGKANCEKGTEAVPRTSDPLENENGP